MENKNEINILAILHSLWSCKRPIIKWTIIGFVVGLVIAFSTPKDYTCNIIVAPESKNNSGSISSMGGLASMMGMNVGGVTNGIGTNVYPTIISSSPFIGEFKNIMVEYNNNQIKLYDYLLKEQSKPWWSYIFAFPSTVMNLIKGSPDLEEKNDPFKPSSKQKAFESIFSSKIAIIEEKKLGIIRMSITMQDPVIAAVVADSLVNKLQKYMTSYYTSKTREDLKNSESMLVQARQNYYTADTIYALAQDKNRNLASKSAQIKVDRLQDERDIAFTIYQQISSQVEMNRLKLQEETPVVTVIESARVPTETSAPNKRNIVVAITFLFAFVYCSILTIKYFMK